MLIVKVLGGTKYQLACCIENAAEELLSMKRPPNQNFAIGLSFAFRYSLRFLCLLMSGYYAVISKSQISPLKDQRSRIQYRKLLGLNTLSQNLYYYRRAVFKI